MQFLHLIWLYPASLALSSWLLMLTIGVIHGEWLPMLPTIGFWQTVVVSLMISALVAGWSFVAEFGKNLLGGE